MRNRAADRHSFFCADNLTVGHLSNSNQQLLRKHLDGAAGRRNPHASLSNKAEPRRGMRASAREKPIPAFLGESR